ncbi:sphingomyelin phosphodiesterase 2 isoform X2 [Ascaphus truei]|uniref:sphingomyelin phosphodiesterase 2 isoform X2 n=1 Tax=Ascaphus truei TaxID=8439 RepID=UPI003F5A0050
MHVTEPGGQTASVGARHLGCCSFHEETSIHHSFLNGTSGLQLPACIAFKTEIEGRAEIDTSSARGSTHPLPVALRIISKKRKERVGLIGRLVSEGGYDLVLLQEIWSDSDYAELKERLSRSHPHAHYFKSGVIGSGLCAFSRFPIIDCLQHQFSLNGLPYMVNHGDWFCGKAVGLIKLQAHGFRCHVYITHLHAEYCRDRDSYQPHRILQSWELAQFIRNTSGGSDIVLLAGDLNMHPGDLGIRLLREWVGLRDAYTESIEYEGPPDGCTLLPCNPYTNPRELRDFPQGIRIDYIMFQSSPGVSVTCHRVTTSSGPTGGDTPCSDHESVTATLSLQRGAGVRGQVREEPPLTVVATLLSACQSELCSGVRSAERCRSASGFLALLCLLLFALQCSVGLLYAVGLCIPYFPPVSITLTLLLLLFLLSSASLVLHTAERRQLQSIADQMSLTERSLRKKEGSD